MARLRLLAQSILLLFACTVTGNLNGAAPPQPFLNGPQAAAVTYFKKLNQDIRVVRGVGGVPETSLVDPHLGTIDKDLRYAQALYSLPNVVSVRVHSFDRDDLDIRLPQLARLKSLKRLDIAGGRFGKAGLAALTRMRGLEVLLVEDSDLTDEGLDAITKAMPGLRKLDISHCHLTSTGYRCLTRLKRLRSLRVWDDGFRSAELRYVPRDTLEDLDVATSRLDDSAGPLLSRFTKLRHLNLGHTRVTGAILLHLAKLKALTDLRLYGTAIGDKGLKGLAGHKNIESLSLEGAFKVGPAVFEVLPTLPRLKYVSLPECRMTQRAVRALLRCRRLEEIEARSAACDDHGLRALVSLPRLKCIWVDAPPTSVDALKRCLRRYPRLELRAYINGVEEWIPSP